MSDERVVYVDSSALIKLAVHEPESSSLRRHLKRRRLVASALARTEVIRALLPFGERAVAHGEDVLSSIDLVRINDRVLRAAATLLPLELRSLDAIHLATAGLFGASLKHVVTYDQRMTSAAVALGWKVVAPA
jgi:predicted nucleic acid-binding protein